MHTITAILGTTGRASIRTLAAILSVCTLVVDSISWTFIAPLKGRGFRFRYALEQFVEFGVHSLPIIALISFLIGAIMGMQSAYQLERFGATIFVANLVGVAALRELAPLMTAILVTGRSGSAITAEIGAMKVAEEIDALEVMGLHPVKYLVAPKFAAMAVALPCLTVLSMLIMVLGGAALAVGVLGIDMGRYLEQTAGALEMKDFATGMVKSLFFALTICWVSVYRGFQVEGGAEGVGKMTTSSVVTSIFLIIIVDLIFTALFFF